MLKTVLRRKRRRWSSSSSRKSRGSRVGGSSKTTARNTTMTITTMTTTTTSTTKSLSRSQTTGYNKWRITNQGTTSKNTNIHPSVGPAKGVKKVRLHTLTKTARHCLC